MLLLYELIIRIYGVILLIAALFHSKARELVRGREQSLDIILNKKSQYPKARWIWIHASSLGEFEQGRYMIDSLSSKFPEYKIALSFYSPSGYLPRSNYVNADMVFYLPLDTLKNAKNLIRVLSPHLAIFIKYDFWWNHLRALQLCSIPTLFISTTIRSNQYFIKYKLGGIRKILTKVNHFYVQTQESAELLNSIDIHTTTVVGDSRLDSIIHEKNEELPIKKEIFDWKINSTCIIYGSIHLTDIEIIKELSSLPGKHLIVPHDVDGKSIEVIQKQLPRAVLYTESGMSDSPIVILDKLGMLRHIYDTSDLVYIGGGFGRGIHNTLEPLVKLVPILIGPNYSKFPEAIDLVSKGAITVVDSAQNARNIANEILASPNKESKAVQQEYISSHSGATQQILSSIVKNGWI